MRASRPVGHLLLFLGAPGVGKGTFASIITKQRPRWKTLSIGEKMRHEVSLGTPLGVKISSRMKKGELVDDATVNELCFESLDSMLLDEVQSAGEGSGSENKCVILDGFPRSRAQSEALMNRYFKNSPIDATINSILAVDIRLDEEVAVQKLLGRKVCQTCNQGFNTADIVHGSYDMPAILPDRETCVLGKEKCAPRLLERTDDTPSTIKHRFEVHTQETEPVISYFRERGMLMTFDVKKGVKDTPQLLDRILSRL